MSVKFLGFGLAVKMASVADTALNHHTLRARIQDFFAGGGGGGSRVDKHQIKVHSVHRIFRAIFYFFFLL